MNVLRRRTWGRHWTSPASGVSISETVRDGVPSFDGQTAKDLIAVSQLAKLLSPLAFLLIQLRLTVLPSGHFPWGFPHRNLYVHLFIPIHATCSAHLIVLGVITPIVLSELYKPRRWWVCNFIRLSSLAQVCNLKHISGVSYSLQHGHISTNQRPQSYEKFRPWPDICVTCTSFWMS